MRRPILFVAFLGCLISIFANSLFAQNFDGKIVRLRNVVTGLFLDSAGSDIYTYKDHNGRHQKWRLNASRSKTYTVTNSGSGHCLDSKGDRLYASPENGGDYQKWELISTGNVYLLKNLKTTTFLYSDSDGQVFAPLKVNSDNYKWDVIIMPAN